MFDSVFSQHLAAFAKPYSQETTILPEKQIKQQLNQLEDKAVALFTNSYNSYIENAIADISKKDDIAKAIAEYKWGFKNELAKNLWGEWLVGLSKGGDHAWLEVKSGATLRNFQSAKERAPKKSKVKSFSASNNIIEFRQPEAESAIIRNVPAEKAIKERANKLSSDVSDSEWKQIKAALLDAVKPTSPTTAPIPRTELLKRINEALGEKKNRFRDRAQTIARTELTFAYNAGRLNSYIESGLVEAVKFISILDNRRCPQCESRHGLIVKLDDAKGIAKIMPPIHPKCRCVISPVMATEFKTEERKKQRQVKNRNIITDAAPWMMAGILAAILTLRGTSSKSQVTSSISQGIKRGVNIGVASTVQAKTTSKDAAKSKIESKDAEIRSKEKLATRYSLLATSNPILLSANIDLQTATFAQLRSLFSQQQLSDKNIYAILDYRDKNGLNSIDELRSVLGIGTVKLQALRSLNQQNQLMSFLDPRMNQSAMQIWVKSGGVVDKAQARNIHKLIQKEQFKSVEELENALKAKGIKDKIITDLKQKAFERQRRDVRRQKLLQEVAQQQSGGDIVPVKAGKGGAIIPTRLIATRVKPDTKAIAASRGARLSAIDNSIADIEGQISLLRSRIELDIKSQQQKLGLQEVIDRSNKGVTTVRQISQNLIEEINPRLSQVSQLNNRIKDLETTLAGLLNPNVEDYFRAYPGVVNSVKQEIQQIRGQLNQVTRYANLETRAASDRAKQLTRGQSKVRKQLPDYEEVGTIRSQIERVASKLDTEALKRGNAVAVLALRAKYRDLISQLESVESLKAKPFRQYSGDKKAISGYLGEVKNKSRNLSNRLAALEERIAKLPSRVSQLSPSVRQEYRKMPTALVKNPDYVPPVRIAPGVQGNKARQVKASRAQRQTTIDNDFQSLEATVTSIRDDADKAWLTKARSKKLKNITSQKDSLEQTANSLQQELAIAARNSSTTVERVENAVDDLLEKVQADVYNPLGDNWFDSKGIIKRESSRLQKQVGKDINASIREIDGKINQLKANQKKATKLKKQIQSLKTEAEKIALDPDSVDTFNRQLEKFLAELDGLTKFEVNAAYYNSQIKKYRDRATNLMQGNVPRSRLLTNINDLIIEVGELENNLSFSSNTGKITTLTQAKERLIAQQQRLKGFPRSVSDLPESARIEWEETRGIRDVTIKAKRKLDRDVEGYRQGVRSQKNKLAQLEEEINRATADVLDSDIYKKNLADGIKKQQDEIKVAVAELDDNLKLFKLATNTEQGLELIYSDLKQIYNSDLPGLAKLKDIPFPVGLDEAMAVKRQIVKFLGDRGDKITKQIKLIVQTDKARSATRYKLSVVENQIQELENLQKAIVNNQKSQAESIKESLFEVFKADPVLHRDLKPAKLLKEVQENTATQANKIKQQLLKLEKVRLNLLSDLQKPIKYNVSSQKTLELVGGIPREVASAGQKELKEVITKYKEEVARLSNTSRRPQLLAIGKELNRRNIKLYGKNSISENLKTNRPLTKGQQKFFDELDPPQQELLIEASRIGLLDLYQDLYQLELVQGLLETDDIETVKNLATILGITDSRRIKKASLKTQRFKEISRHLNELKGMGYQGLGIELASDSAKFVGLSEPPKSLIARKQWELLRKTLGVNRDGMPIPVSDIKIVALANGTLKDYTDVTYNEVLKAIAVNRQLRYEINNRLSAFNFNKYERGVRYFGKN